MLVNGLHHVTALTSDAQKNLNFYAGVLGLRMVKKTVNFDAPEVYHLYYGNEKGDPGTIMTFFPYQGLRQGRKGKGQQTVTSFSIGLGSLDYWIKRLQKFNIAFKEPQEKYQNEIAIYFEDFDGTGIEIVANKEDERVGFSYGHIPIENSIKGFYGVTLLQEGYERTAALLIDKMNHQLIRENGNRLRFSTTNKPGDYVDIICSPDELIGLSGSGTIHHLAFATQNDASQDIIREQILSHGLDVTPRVDRQYFHSIYFREPGGVLFEVATSDIGFTKDEQLESLGNELKLPLWQEENRSEIEKDLKPIILDISRFHD